MNKQNYYRIFLFLLGTTLFIRCNNEDNSEDETVDKTNIYDFELMQMLTMSPPSSKNTPDYLRRRI